MAKKTATKQAARKAAKKTVHRAPRVAAATPAQGETAMYEVLTPFKFHDAVVKPPAFVECSADEAREYQDAGVLGTEPGEVPDPNSGEDGTGETDTK